MALKDDIHEFSRAMPEGEFVAPNDLLNFGNRLDVFRALRELVADNKMSRLSPGMYVPWIEYQFGRHLPDSTLVFEAIERKTGEIIVESPATSANNLRLTTQNPIVEIVFTSGEPRKLMFGWREVFIRKAPAYYYLLGKGIVGAAVRALDRAGGYGKQISSKEIQRTVKHLESMLSASQRHEIFCARGQLPGWMAAAVAGWEFVN